MDKFTWKHVDELPALISKIKSIAEAQALLKCEAWCELTTRIEENTLMRHFPINEDYNADWEEYCENCKSTLKHIRKELCNVVDLLRSKHNGTATIDAMKEIMRCLNCYDDNCEPLFLPQNKINGKWYFCSKEAPCYCRQQQMMTGWLPSTIGGNWGLLTYKERDEECPIVARGFAAFLLSQISAIEKDENEYYLLYHDKASIKDLQKEYKALCLDAMAKDNARGFNKKIKRYEASGDKEAVERILRIDIPQAFYEEEASHATSSASIDKEIFHNLLKPQVEAFLASIKPQPNITSEASIKPQPNVTSEAIDEASANASTSTINVEALKELFNFDGDGAKVSNRTFGQFITQLNDANFLINGKEVAALAFLISNCKERNRKYRFNPFLPTSDYTTGFYYKFCQMIGKPNFFSKSNNPNKIQDALKIIQQQVVSFIHLDKDYKPRRCHKR